MFRLPNNACVTERTVSALCAALIDSRGTHTHLLDRETGDLVSIHERHHHKLARHSDRGRYVIVPHISQETRVEWMHQFVRACLRDSSEGAGAWVAGQSDTVVRTRVVDVDTVESLLRRTSNDAYVSWRTWEDQKLYERIKGWLACAPISAIDDHDWSLDHISGADMYQPLEGGYRVRSAHPDPRVSRIVVQEDPYPAWLDCEWRRDPCDMQSCPVCSVLESQRDGLVSTDRSADGGAPGAGVAEVFERALAQLRVVAVRTGTEEPLPGGRDDEALLGIDELTLMQTLLTWRAQVHGLFETAYETGLFWPGTECGADLAWYANTLVTKSYRQCVNVWDLQRVDTSAHADYAYVARVLREVLDILFVTLETLAVHATDRQPFIESLQTLNTCTHDIQALLGEK
jgi:hypothetical protein